MRGLDKEYLADEFTDWLWEEHKLEVDELSTDRADELYQEFEDSLPEPDAMDEFKRDRAMREGY